MTRQQPTTAATTQGVTGRELYDRLHEEGRPALYPFEALTEEGQGIYNDAAKQFNAESESHSTNRPGEQPGQKG